MPENKCESCEQRSACIPFYAHENTMMHYNRANKRMLIALIVSVTVVMVGMAILGFMFLSSYNDREKGWQDIVNRCITEVTDEQTGSP